MKTTFVSVSLLALAATASHAAVMVSVSGGSGAPISITLLSPVTFTGVPTGQTSYLFALIGAAAGNTVQSFSGHTGDMAWNETGSNAGGGTMGTYLENDLTLGDLYSFWSPGPSTTSEMTLSTGTRTTIDSITATVVQGMHSYEIRMMDSNGNIIGNAGTQVPEPSVAALLSLGLAAAFRRRRS